MPHTAPQPACLPFFKMNGLGNAFIIVDGRRYSAALAGEAVARLGQHADAFAFDQLVALESTGTEADLAMRIYNRDGTMAEACGNATRCVAALVLQENGRDHALIATDAGTLHAMRDGDHDGDIIVDMGRPGLRWDDIPLAAPIDDTTHIPLPGETGNSSLPSIFTAVNMGNPHVIFWVDDVMRVDLERAGPMLETHALFPQRANISVAAIESRHDIRARVWERGAGLTRACGTAACAIAVAAARCNLSARAVKIHLPGGPLRICWRNDDRVTMSGPVETEFSGTLDLDRLIYHRDQMPQLAQADGHHIEAGPARSQGRS